LSEKKPTYKETHKKLADAEANAGLRNTDHRTLKTERSTARIERDESRNLIKTASLGTQQIKKAYAESEENFRNSLDASPLGVRIVSKSGELIYVNRTMLDIYGYRNIDELRALTREQLHTPESYIAYRAREEKRKRGEPVPAEFEISIRRPDGTVRHLQVFRQEIIWERERQFMAMYQDITGRRQAEEALANEAIRRRILVEQSRDGIVVLNQDGGVYEANQQFAAMVGYTHAELLKLHVWDWDTQWSKEHLMGMIVSVSEAGDHFETRHRRKDGSTIEVEISTNGAMFGRQKLVFCVCRDITIRKRLEEQLIKSEAKYRSLVEETSSGIATIDPAGKITYANDALCRMIGYSLQEILGKPFSFFLHPDEQNRLLSIFQEAYTHPEKRLNLEFRTFDKQGNVRYLSSTPTVIKRDDKIYGFSAIIQDVTDRKISELKFLESQKKFQALVETTNDFIWEMDLQGVYTYCSPQMEKLWGLKPEEMLGKTPFDLVPPEDREQAVKGFSALSASSSPILNIETSSFDSAGQIKFLEISGVPFYDADGKPRGYRGITRDITGRKMARAAITESELKYRLIFENSRDAILLTSPDGGIIAANPAATRLFGRTEEEICRLGRSGILDAADPRLASALEARQTTGEFVGELTFLRADGVKFPGELSTKIFFDKDKKPRTSMIIRDITERKQAEETLHEAEFQYRTVADFTYDWEYWENPENTFRYVSPSCERISGYQAAEFMSNPGLLSTIVVPEDKEIWLQHLRQVSQNQDGLEIQFRIRRKDGEMCWIEHACQPVFDGQGKYLGHRASNRDITERKRAEEALQKSEINNHLLADYYKRLNNISINFNEAIDITDLFEKIAENFRLLTDANASSFSAYDQDARVLKVMSLSIDPTSRNSVISMLGTDLFKMQIPVSAGDMEQMLTQSIRRPKDLHELTSGVLPKDISDSVMDAIECHQIIALAISYSGEIIGTCVAYLRGDQTVVPDEALKTYLYLSGLAIKRKQAEEKQVESNDKFSKAFHTSPNLMTITTINEGRIIEINDAFCNATGYAREETIGKTTAELNVWNNPEQRGTILRRLQADGQVNNIEAEIRTKTGKIRMVIISMTLITLNKTQLLLTVAMDITERKRAEEELKALSSRQEAILAAVPDIIMEVDNNKIYTWANQAGLEFFGDDVIGKEAVFYFEGEQATYNTVKPLFNGDTSIIYLESWQRRRDGEKRLLAWWCRVLKDQTGNVVGALSSARDITERRQAEESIRYLANLVQNVSDAIISSDKERKLLTWNKAAEELYGWREDEVIGKTILEVINPKLEKISSKEYFEFLMKNGYWKGEAIHYRKDGEKLYVLASVSLIKDAEGNELGAVGAFTDITDRHRLEEALRESEARYRTLFESAAEGIIIADVVSRKFKYANPAICKLFGYTQQEFTGMSISDIHPPGDLENVIAEFDVLSRGEKTLASGIPCLKKDSTIFYADIKGDRAIIDGTNCSIGFFTDVTEHKQAEERINHLNLTLHSIRDVDHLITREKDRDRLIQGICNSMVESHSFSSAWIILLDESRKPINWAAAEKSSVVSHLVNSFHQGVFPRCAEQALNQKQLVLTEIPYTMCKDCPLWDGDKNIGSMTIRLETEGNIYGVLCAGMQRSLIADKDGIALFQEMATDIAFALHDLKLKEQNVLLEQERLRSAKLESIGTLAGGIAHDFNNLLTGIMGNIGLAKITVQPPDPAFEMLDEAEKAAVRAKDLTQQLLTFARGGKPVKKLVNLAALVKESAAFALRGSNVKLELILPDNLWTLEADEGQIGQVINNLVINADEAMPSGGTLVIEALNVVLNRTSGLPVPNGNYVRIDIKDTGMGISQEHLQRIFEPYFTTKQRGSGLGLTTAYSIVRSHGGYILAESTQNKGSVFHIYLPASKKAAKGGRKVVTADPGQAGGKVLVMDDEEIIRKMLKNMMNLVGYEVELSADGEEAVEKYRHAMQAGNPFDAVIMDLTIPGGMGGKEAVKKVLEIDPQAAVIVSSGYATDAIMSDYKKYGFKAVIAKPYSVKQLQATLSGLPKRANK
jgi:PAS domain S-box-containing protein